MEASVRKTTVNLMVRRRDANTLEAKDGGERDLARIVVRDVGWGLTGVAGARGRRDRSLHGKGKVFSERNDGEKD